MTKKMKAENKVKLTPSDARAIWDYKLFFLCAKDYNNLKVDYSLFYKDHCKIHPIDLVLNQIKKSAEESDRPECYIYPSMIFDNLDYEKKFIHREEDWPDTFWQKVFHKKVHHEWDEEDWGHLNRYLKMTENIMHELWIYLLKAGWRVTYVTIREKPEKIRYLHIYF